MKTIIEPFKIKVVEPIKMSTREEREEIIKNAGYNVFKIKSEDVLIDLLTDSGTAAMSAAQWAAIMNGDEAYAGSKSYFELEETVRELMGFKHLIPTHQGRAAERILFSLLGGQGKSVPNNTHFDTTRANCEFSGAKAVDFVISQGLIPEERHPFKGNMDVEKLEEYIKMTGAENIPLIIMTITNNSMGGQPVSLENLKCVREVSLKYGIPLFFDAARFAENAYFIKLREPGYSGKSVKEIVREMFSLADGTTVSAKKDGLVNIGGFIALNDDKLAEKARTILILTEGFVTYGGLAGRDLAALAQGLKEVIEEDYLKYRIRTIEYFGRKLTQGGIPIIQPAGGHAVYIDARGMLKHIERHEFPGQALVVELYLDSGVRGVEIGSVMFKNEAKMELVRLALPRRVYTQAHVDYVCESLLNIQKRKHELGGFKITRESEYLRHFTCEFEPLRHAQ